MKSSVVNFICQLEMVVLIRRMFLYFFFFRVLKPPGGGSSLSFFGDSNEELSPRRVKNHQTSNLPLGEVENNERKNGNSSAESVDGTSTPSQSSASNGSPANSEPTTPRSGEFCRKITTFRSLCGLIPGVADVVTKN